MSTIYSDPVTGKLFRAVDWLAVEREFQKADKSWHTYRSSMQNHELKIVLGCSPTKHWPNEGVPARMVGNIKVWVEPKTSTAVYFDNWAQRFRRSGWKSRAFCQCPCGKVINAGRLNQHRKGCDK